MATKQKTNRKTIIGAEPCFLEELVDATKTTRQAAKHGDVVGLLANYAWRKVGEVRRGCAPFHLSGDVLKFWKPAVEWAENHEGAVYPLCLADKRVFPMACKCDKQHAQRRRIENIIGICNVGAVIYGPGLFDRELLGFFLLNPNGTIAVRHRFPVPTDVFWCRHSRLQVAVVDGLKTANQRVIFNPDLIHHLEDIFG